MLQQHSRPIMLQRLEAAGILLMDKILHDPEDPKLWELWYIPFHG